MLYVILQGFTMIAQGTTTGDISIWSNLNGMYKTNLTQNVVISAVSAIWAPAASVLSVISTFLQAVVMYYPALFTGYYVWLWWCLLLPISVGFVIVIISMIRGVHSG